ncbi:MAG TPA: elongation factor P maturation arginine rhamnosyltransferase EarP [Burkholderiaceae bacterium]
MRTLALFCKVVDNYGDIGICWRLARQLHDEHAIAVTLWVDDLASFKRLCPQVDLAAPEQHIAGVTVVHWQSQDGAFAVSEVADIVIEFFGCELPPAYVEAMARREPRPVWINFDGLSAEAWVEGCHTLPSPHPRLPITKYFFYPGYTSATGGLLHEAGLTDARRAFQADAAQRAAWLETLGVTPAERDALLVSLFCYPHAPAPALFKAWEQGAAPVACLVPEGVASGAVSAWLGRPASAGASGRRGHLHLRVVPFLPQPDYDKLLWSCDLNFVRGEDSWVRGQWAGRPLVWHIYPQDEQLHHKKLRAFLDRYDVAADSLRSFMLHWNGAAGEGADWAQCWQALAADLAGMTSACDDWETRMLTHGDLASNLLKFVANQR